MELHQMVLNTPVGRIMLEENGRAMTRLSFCSAEVSGSFFEKTPLLLQASEQIIGYFSGNLKNFQLPLEPEGTSFQKQVWALLQQIPYGETRSYRQIAEQMGNPSACRAVGAAVGRNPLLILIPCHRVIGISGRLTGYAGGLKAKAALLHLEGGKNIFPEAE